VLRRVKA